MRPPQWSRSLDEMGIDSGAILGNSMGGGVGANVAAAHPERVTRFATIGGVGVNVYSTMPSEGIRALVDFVEDPTRPNLVRWIQSMLYDQAYLTDALVEERWKQATAPGAVEWMKKMYSRAGSQALPGVMSGAYGPPPWLSLGQDPRRPPACSCGGRDDRVSPVDMSIVLMRIVPRCELHVSLRTVGMLGDVGTQGRVRERGAQLLHAPLTTRHRGKGAAPTSGTCLNSVAHRRHTLPPVR